MSPLLSVKSLSLSINGAQLLHNLSFEIFEGRVLGLVGESGSGKSLTALSLMGLAPPGARISGTVDFDGDALLAGRASAQASLRGRRMAMVFQEPMSALNPVQTIGAQVAEVFQHHLGLTGKKALARAADLLERTGLSPSRYPLSRYPFELSGGQRQRVMIAMAMALKPKLLIADEPTTALDVTTEAQILSLLKNLCAEDKTALLFISHNLAAVAQLADHIAVMKNGEIVEQASAAKILTRASHPYTQSLLRADKSVKENPQQALAQQGAPVLEVKNLSQDYRLPRRHFFAQARRFSAVRQVSFLLRAGECLGVAGESGCGKSTLMRAVLGLEAPSEGVVILHGEQFNPAPAYEQRRRRSKIQAVFQDPYGSFNPRHKVGRIVAEPLALSEKTVTAEERRDFTAAALENVGLEKADAEKYPHEFSGGQRQRIAIARALIVSPSIVVLDEATSALDAPVRQRILDLLKDLSARLGLSYLFISHDLESIRRATDRVLIMKQGAIVEEGETEKIFAAPHHPYTKSLIAAKPDLQSEIEKLKPEGDAISATQSQGE